MSEDELPGSSAQQTSVAPSDLEARVNKSRKPKGIFAKAIGATCSLALGIAAYDASHGGKTAKFFLNAHDKAIVPAQDLAGRLFEKTEYSMLDIGAAALIGAGIAYTMTRLKKRKPLLPGFIKDAWAKSKGQRMAQSLTLCATLAGPLYAGWVASHVINNQRETTLREPRTLSDDELSRRIGPYYQSIIDMRDAVAVVMSAKDFSSYAGSRGYSFIHDVAEQVVSEKLGRRVDLPKVKKSFFACVYDNPFYDIVTGEPVIPPADYSCLGNHAHELAHRYFADECSATMLEQEIMRRSFQMTKDPFLLGHMLDTYGRHLEKVFIDKAGRVTLVREPIQLLWSRNGKSYVDARVDQLSNFQLSWAPDREAITVRPAIDPRPLRLSASVVGIQVTDFGNVVLDPDVPRDSHDLLVARVAGSYDSSQAVLISCGDRVYVQRPILVEPGKSLRIDVDLLSIDHPRFTRSIFLAGRMDSGSVVEYAMPAQEWREAVKRGELGAKPALRSEMNEFFLLSLNGPASRFYVEARARRSLEQSKRVAQMNAEGEVRFAGIVQYKDTTCAAYEFSTKEGYPWIAVYAVNQDVLSEISYHEALLDNANVESRIRRLMPILAAKGYELRYHDHDPIYSAGSANPVCISGEVYRFERPNKESLDVVIHDDVTRKTRQLRPTLSNAHHYVVTRYGAQTWSLEHDLAVVLQEIPLASR